MAGARCSCGFTEFGDEAVADHLLEMFASQDCRGNDGLPHLEVMPDLTCSCGLAAATSGAGERAAPATGTSHTSTGTSPPLTGLAST